MDGVATPDDPALDAGFEAIVSGLAPTMDWDLSPAGQPADEQAQRRLEDQQRQAREAEERRIRREQRRLERARELAEFNAEKAALEAEYNSSDDHFTPPDPPPLPRLRPATAGAVLLILLGVALVAFPALLNLGQQVTLVLGVMLIIGGAAVLVSRLRRSDEDDPGPGAVL